MTDDLTELEPFRREAIIACDTDAAIEAAMRELTGLLRHAQDPRFATESAAVLGREVRVAPLWRLPLAEVVYEFAVVRADTAMGELWKRWALMDDEIAALAEATGLQ